MFTPYKLSVILSRVYWGHSEDPSWEEAHVLYIQLISSLPPALSELKGVHKGKKAVKCAEGATLH